jgi:curved DNA-binding protein CbpA
MASEPRQLETSKDLLDRIKKLDNQIKWCTDLSRRRGYILTRNKLADQYNKLTGKTAARSSITLEKARQILGLPPGVNPTPDELKRIYRMKSLAAHPDRGGSPDAMREVNEAYDILTGKAKPATYDFRTPPPRPQNPPPWQGAGPYKRDPRDDEERRRRQERQERDDRQRAEERQRKREEEAAKKRQEAEKKKQEKRQKPVPASKDPIGRARMRMYESYDKAPGDAVAKFTKMLISLRVRIRAIKEPAKLQGVIDMLRQETTQPEFMRRWSPSEIHVLKQVLQSLERS